MEIGAGHFGFFGFSGNPSWITTELFQLSENTLSSLIKALRDADFGIFVFSPDDVALMRGTAMNVVRDNVLFELGLFIGRLGAERCFFLIPDDATDLRLPSDLAGITPGVYESGRSDGNWMAALNPACMQMKAQIARLKSFQDAGEDSGSAVAEPVAKKPPAPKPVPTPTSRLKAAKSGLGGDLSAATYKNSYLVTGNTKEHKDKLKEVGCSWNGKLEGWVLAPAKLEKLREVFPAIKIEE